MREWMKTNQYENMEPTQQKRKGRTEENKRLQNATQTIMKPKCWNTKKSDNENEI
jgi:hypothetical protein